MNKTLKHAPALAALVAAMALVGCGRNNDEQTVGQQVDATVAKAEQKAEEMKSDAAIGMEKAKESAREMGQDAKVATGNAVDKIGDKVSDAMITSSVNAELAKDNDLSALKINVDTQNGHVLLKGSAPDNEARERASRLAANVKGVTSVGNELVVQGNM